MSRIGNKHITLPAGVTVEQADNKDAKIMYNYTLTDDNYNQIKDIYSGSLYKEYSILITSV
jgi:hypothetical protein